MTNNLDNLGVIRQLDELTASQIAAGEVVERPVSVVKELVENAIDAGAGRITVRLTADEDLQYIDEIQVVDDGCGMLAVDLQRAFGRHATSKLAGADELSTVRTLGFRGEALPSIAAVSRVEIASTARGEIAGYAVLAADGKVTDLGETALAEGTRVTVRNLFYNTPARKKFLKAYATETGYISKLVGDLILSRPDIAFALEIDGRKVLRSPGGGSVIKADKAVMSVYGAEVLAALRPVAYCRGEVSVDGFVSMPPFARSSRRYYHFFVNGRLVKSAELNSIVDTAYLSLLPENKHPLVALYITLPTQTVDVNVHPAKTEIRFHQLAVVREAVLQAVRQALALKAPEKAAEVPVEKPVEQPKTSKPQPAADGLQLIMSILSGHKAEQEQADASHLPPAFAPAVENVVENEAPLKVAEDNLSWSDELVIEPSVAYQPPKQTEITEKDGDNMQNNTQNIENKTEKQQNVPKSNINSTENHIEEKLAEGKAAELDLTKLSGAELTSILGKQDEKPDMATKFFQSLLATAPGHKVEYSRDDGDWLAENFGITYMENYDQPKLFDAETNLFLAMKPLGQLNNSYIIAALNEDLYIIDQHAAHERILFEEFALSFGIDSRETSLLAVPVRVDVGDLHTELLLNNINRLADFGFVLEYFGGSSFVVRGVPLWYVRGSESINQRKSKIYDNDVAGFFLDVFDMLLESGDDEVLDIARLNSVELFTKACKSAIKANARLNNQEITWLLYNLSECEKPQTCPHGRPTFFKLTDEEIRRRFMRS